MLKVWLLFLFVAVFSLLNAQRGAEEPKVAQALAFRCQTQFGICPIPPAPIGAPCFCGQVPGRVVP